MATILSNLSGRKSRSNHLFFKFWNNVKKKIEDIFKSIRGSEDKLLEKINTDFRRIFAAIHWAIKK